MIKWKIIFKMKCKFTKDTFQIRIEQCYIIIIRWYKKLRIKTLKRIRKLEINAQLRIIYFKEKKMNLFTIYLYFFNNLNRFNYSILI